MIPSIFIKKIVLYVGVFVCFMISVVDLPPLHAQIDQFVTIVDSDLSFFSDPEGTVPAGKAGKENFGKSFPVIKTYNEYIQIACNGSDVWIHDDENNDAILRNDEYKNYIEAEKQEKVTRKALVVNSFRAKNLDAEVKFFHAGNLTGSPMDSVTIFEVRYVFKISDSAILVGRSDRFTMNTSSDTLDGWIDKNNVVIWNNKIGFEFNKDNFDQRRSCELGKISLRTGLDTTEPIYTEADSKKWMKYYSNRFPVLRKSGSDSYKVAYIGSAKGTGQGDQQQYSKAQIEEMKQTMDQVINSSAVQIAILIDATKGMEHHIENVKNALNRFIRDLGSVTSMQIELSLAVYRDYPDNEKIYETISDFTGNLDQIIDGLMQISVYSNPNDKGEGTYPEAVFYGIEQTILTHSWRRKGAEGFILLLGDHGNHEDSRIQYPQDARLSTMGLGELLQENRITLNAVQVNLSESKRRFNDMFRRQVKEIQQYNKGFGHLVSVSTNSTRKIEEALRKSMSIFEDIHKVMYDARASQAGGGASGAGGTSDSVLDDFSGYSGVYTQKIFSRYGIDPAMFNSVQICSLGHVNWKNSCGDVQIALRVLMTKKEVESLKTQMTELSDSIVYYEPETADDFERTIYKVVKSLTGDRISPNESIAEFIERKSGIPIQTKFLSYSMDTLLEKIREEEVRREFRKSLQLKLLRLEEITRERRIVVGNWDYSFQDYEWEDCEGEGCRIDYFFSLDQPLRFRGKVVISNNKKQHVWVPLAYLP